MTLLYRRLSSGAGAIRPLFATLLLGVALVLLWLATSQATLLMNYPYPVDSLEGTLLHEARLLRAGEPLYQPLELYRFTSAPYPPFHPLLLAQVDRFIGPHIFWYGRLISLCAALAVALLSILLVRSLSGSWSAAVLSTAILLSAPPFYIWATRIKPDLLALMWTTLGLSLATWARTGTLRISRSRADHTPSPPAPLPPGEREDSAPEYVRPPLSRSGRGGWGERAERRRDHYSKSIGFKGEQEAGGRSQDRTAGNTRSTLRLIAAALCFSLAFLTKQTAVTAPLATGLALLIDDLLAWYHTRAEDTPPRPLLRRLRSLISPQTWIFVATYMILALGTWAILDVIYAGQYTVHVWWSGDRVRWWSLALLLKITGLLLPYWPLLLFGAIAAIMGMGRYTSRTLACYALVVPLSLSATGEIGANHNHLLETLLAYSLCAGMLVGWLLTQQLSGAGRTGIIGRYLSLVVVLSAQVWLIFHPPAWYGSELNPALRSNPERFIKFMHATPGEILTDNPGLLLMADKPIRYDDPSTMGAAARIGKWDQRGMLDDIANHRFSTIMIPLNVREDTIDPSGRWSPEMIAAIAQYYTLLYDDQIITYVPR
jgi:hypothetical protein